MDDSVLLHLDTTANQLLLGLSVNQQFLFTYQSEAGSFRKHSALLIPTIQRALKESKLTLQSLTGITANRGPGSFTGIRTGLTTVKTLCQFLHIPVYGFNTFELLAAQHRGQPVAVYIDALQGQAYHARLLCSADGKTSYITEPCLIKLDTATQEKDELVIASERLQALPLFNNTLCIEAMNVNLLTAIPLLIAQHPEVFLHNWHTLQPLYIQAPNITLPKPKTHTPSL